MTRQHRQNGGRQPMETSAEHFAHRAGGPARVIDTAVVRLHLAGRITVTRTARVTVHHDTVAADSPALDAVLAAEARGRRSVSLAALRAAAADWPAVDALRGVSRRELRALRRQAPWEASPEEDGPRVLKVAVLGVRTGLTWDPRLRAVLLGGDCADRARRLVGQARRAARPARTVGHASRADELLLSHAADLGHDQQQCGGASHHG
nr:TIGR04222 domain-containing membrane protein [Mangrovactinospora gilvigrisea]